MLPADYLYATCAPGLEQLLAAELRTLGAESVSTAGAGVRFTGSLKIAYQVCLWSRVANRVLLPLHSGVAASPEDLYALVQEIDWSSHLSVDGTLAVDFFTSHSTITHSQYGALKVKDAIVDQFRSRTGVRPNVERETPDVRINVYLFRNKARIAIDLSGASLHRRGYREQGGMAPLKENLAAALLLACDWPAIAAEGGSFVDPMCGSGTLLVEAAMIASRRAPGLGRDYFGFLGWAGHDAEAWSTMVEDAKQAVINPDCTLVGSDNDSRAVALARQNLRLSGVDQWVTVEEQSIETGPASAAANVVPGLLLSNPPYGERLAGDAAFYTLLGRSLSRFYAGWPCGLFTSKEAPLQRARLPLKPVLAVRNGGIDCALMFGEIPGMLRATALHREADHHRETDIDHGQQKFAWPARPEPSSDSREAGDDAPHVHIAPFLNRLRKNQRSLKGWLKRGGIRAWRLYDADLPEFAVAIDVYDCDERHLVVQEYQAPATVNAIMAEARLARVLEVLPEALSTDTKHVHTRVRERQSGLQQYEKQDGRGITGLLQESGCSVELNFSDYLDTGLFLDHRKVRRFITDNASGKRFLNLFAYTGSATVAAVQGGAGSSVSVDLSNKYCQWMQRNLSYNKADASMHQVVRDDVQSWLRTQQSTSSRFDLILLDPPTFSNSTGVEADWNVQRDHVSIIQACMALLDADGLLIFSNNFRRFRLDTELLQEIHKFAVEDRSHWSIDRDFQRNQRIHQCWFIRHSTV